jgi:FemAB-related protein (PEP-CTERM system-associated)
MEVLELREQDRQDWDEYARGSSHTTPFQLVGWRDVMEETFGHQTHYLFAAVGGQIVGILPLLHIESRLSGRFLTSLPGGVCADDDGVAERLVERGKELTATGRARYLILRDGHRRWNVPGLITNADHYTLVVRLSRDRSQVWQRIERRARQLTERALKAEVEVVTGLEALDDLYPVYSRAMRNRGTPTLGLRFFRLAAARFPAHFSLMTVRHGDQILGGGFIAPFRDTVYCVWGGMLRCHYDLCPNHLLYWETLKYGCDNGFRWVDLGRSRYNSGTFVFKMNWGAEPRPLYQQYYLNGNSRPPAVGSGLEADSQYRLFVKIWRRLPLCVTEVLGPKLRERMPFG